MKKMKKLFAILMTMAMVMGLSITGFAAESTDVVVNNLEEGTTIQAVQVIEPDSTKETGWDFVDNADIRRAYADAFGKTGNVTDDDYQAIIWSLIKFENPNNTHIPNGTAAATSDQIKNALAAMEINEDIDYNLTINQDGKSFTVTTAGVYAIKATPKEGSDTVYNPMAAYVSFTYTNGIPTLPDDDVTVNAKKTEVPVEKTVEDDDNATGIGKTVTYKVETAVPYNVTTWKFTDTITGASYVTVKDGDPVLVEEPDVLGKVPVQVKVGTGSFATYYATVTNNSFELDLSNIATNATYRGQEVVFTYEAVVTGTEVNNKIQYDDEHTSGEVKLYTGTITFTKFDEDGTTKLGGAGFIISRVENGVTEYAQFTETDNNAYTLLGWTKTKGDATEVFTNNNSKFSGYGTLTVSGLDKGTEYIFTEKTAPEGYSLNKKPEKVNFTAGEVIAVFTTEGSMKDTKISELPLPETGGMGTTLFTIAGCVIMISAAGLFFATRKKAN